MIWINLLWCLSSGKLDLNFSVTRFIHKRNCISVMYSLGIAHDSELAQFISFLITCGVVNRSFAPIIRSLFEALAVISQPLILLPISPYPQGPHIQLPLPSFGSPTCYLLSCTPLKPKTCHPSSLHAVNTLPFVLTSCPFRWFWWKDGKWGKEDGRREDGERKIVGVDKGEVMSEG